MTMNRIAGGACALLLSATVAFASPGHGNGPAYGQAGHEAEVDRVIEVSMDEMTFSPARIEVREGETVKFVVRNDGRIVHEFNLGTKETWNSHRGEMQTMVKMGMMNMRQIKHEKMEAAGMMHDDPNSVLLEPGQTAEVIWTFSEATQMGFACNVPGHRAAGMVGEVHFK